MSIVVQTRRGNTAATSTFTGAAGELTVDTDKHVVVVHDGATTGGHPMVSAVNPTFTGNATFANGTTTFANSVFSGVSTQFSSNVTFNDGLSVAQTALFNAAINANNDLTVNGRVNFNNTFVVNSLSTFRGNVNVNGYFDVSNTADFYSLVTTHGNLVVNGHADVQNTFDAYSLSTFHGITIFQANAVVNAHLEVANNARFDGNVRILDYLTVGNSTVNTFITPGNVYLNGSTLVVGNTSTNVTINATSIAIGNTLVINSTAVTVNGSPITGTNTDDQYIWTNTHTFNANVLIGNSSTTSFTVNTESVYVNTDYGFIVGEDFLTGNTWTRIYPGKVFATSNNGAISQVTTYSDTTVSKIEIRRSGGDSSSPTDLSIGDEIGRLDFVPYPSGWGNWSSGPPVTAAIVGEVSSSLSSSFTGEPYADLVFKLGDGFIFDAEKLRITANSINIANTIGIVANGSLGTSGQALTSNGSAVYWSVPDTANNANYLGGNTASDLQTYADTVAGDAYINATSYADTKASDAYSNAVTYTDTSITTVNTAITSNAAAAYSNATSYADTKSAAAYSNATSYTDTKIATANLAITGNAATAYSNATSYTDTKAATTYSNATSYADTKAATAYSNAVSTAATDASSKAATAYSNATSYTDTKIATANLAITGNAATAYSNAVSTAATDASSKAATAYSNATSYTDTKIATANLAITGNAATAYSNATAYTDTKIGTANAAITGNAATAYSNAVSYTDTKIATANLAITGNAATAYSNATAYTDTKIATANLAITGNAATAYSNAVSYTDTKIGTANAAITGNAATAYSNAVAYAASNTYVNNTFAPLAGATFTGAVTISNNLTVSGNLTLTGNNLVVGANNLIVQDAVISLHTPANGAPLTTNDGKLVGTALHYYNGADSQALLALNQTTRRLAYWANSTDAALADPTGTTLGTIQALDFWVGNDTVYSTVNATTFNGTANNATNFNGQAAAYYTNATNITTGTLPWAQAPSGTANTSAQLTWSNTQTFSNTITFSQTIVGTVNNALNLGGTAAAGYQTTAGLSANVATLAANSSTYANSSVTNTFTIGTAAYHVANGNFGIGNSSPTNKLHVNGTTYLSDHVGLGTSTNKVEYIDPTATGMTIGGNTLPSIALWNTINDGVFGVFTDSNDAFLWNFAPGGLHLVTNNDYGSSITISSNGNVGIGYFIPLDYKLSVMGTAYVSNSITVGNSTVNATVNSTIFTGKALTANNTTYLNGQLASYYTNATNITTGTLPWAQAPSGTVNSSAAFTISGVHTHNANVVLNNNKTLNFQTVNSSAYVGFIQQNDDNFVFYTTNTAYGSRAVFSIYSNSATAPLSFSVPVQFNTTVTLGTSPVSANGSQGTSGQVLTTDGTKTYWSTVSGGGSVNTAANVAFTGNNISLVSNTGSVLFAGGSDNNWRIGRNTNNTTKFYYTNNSLDIIAANSNLEGIVFGYTGNSYLETGYAGTFTRNPIYVGNSTVNTSINATTFSGTANNATYLNGQLASYYTNATNITSGTLPYAQLGVNVVNTTANFTFTGVETFNANVVLGSGLSANGGYGTAGQVLATNGTATYWLSLAGVNTASQYTWSNTQTFQNTITFSTNILVGTTVNATSYNTGGGYGSATGGAIVNTTIIAVGNSTVNATVNATTFTGTSLTANNATNLGGQAAAYYTNATNITTGTLPYAQLGVNVINTTAAFTITGVHTHSANVSITGTTKMTGVIDGASANTLNQTLTDGATVSFDASLGQVATLTLGGNRTIANPTNMKVATYVLHLVQDATGSRTVTWGTAYKWPGGVAPTLSTGANKRDIISFISDGTNMYGSYLIDVR